MECLKDIFDCLYWGDAIGFWWVETRDDEKHSVMPRTALTTKNYLVPNASSTKVEKPYYNHKVKI